MSLNVFLVLGAVLLDLEKFDLPSIAEAVIDEMVITDQLDRSQSAKVLSALLSKHRHQHQMTRGLPRRSSSTNLASLFGVEPKSTPLKAHETEVVVEEPSAAHTDNIPLEPARPRATSDASSQTPFSTLDYLSKVTTSVPIASTRQIKENKVIVFPDAGNCKAAEKRSEMRRADTRVYSRKSRIFLSVRITSKDRKNIFGLSLIKK